MSDRSTASYLAGQAFEWKTDIGEYLAGKIADTRQLEIVSIVVMVK